MNFQKIKDVIRSEKRKATAERKKINSKVGDLTPIEVLSEKRLLGYIEGLSFVEMLIAQEEKDEGTAV